MSRIPSSSVRIMDELKHSMKYYYPELYKYIFGGRNDPYDSLIIFISSHGDGKVSVWDYQEIWDFIVVNKDKHDWWML